MSLLVMGRRRGGNPDPLLRHLPSGLTLHADNSFENPLAGNDTTVVDGWNTVSCSFTQDGVTYTSPDRFADSSGGFGSHIARVRCPEGTLGGFDGVGGTGFGGFNTVTGLNWRQMYFALRIKFSPDYCVHTVDEKFLYPTYNVSPTFQSPMFGLNQAGTTGTGNIGFNGFRYDISNAFSELTDFVIPRGEWGDLAFYWYLNTPDTPDGVARIWWNDTVVLDIPAWQGYKGTATQLLIDRVRFSSTRGGGTSAVAVPEGGMWRDIDRMVLYGSTT